MEQLFLSPVVFLEEDGSSLSNLLEPYPTIAIIGGKTALHKAQHLLEPILHQHSASTHVYGKECTQENVLSLSENPFIQKADLILGVGGGKALDTCKLLAQHLSKPIITLPTIASTCACSSKVAVRYSPEHVFQEVVTLDRPPVAVAIPLRILVEAPIRYLWAGIGDTLAKPIEIEFCVRNKDLTLSEAMSKQISGLCLEQCLTHGHQAYLDHQKGQISDAFKQTCFTILITTGYASTLIDYQYGGSLAHAFNNALTHIESIEHNHLHGEVVSLGVLLLLGVDGQTDVLKRLLPFYQALGLPMRLSQLGLAMDREVLDGILTTTLNSPDMDHKPYPISKETLYQVLQSLESNRS